MDAKLPSVFFLASIFIWILTYLKETKYKLFKNYIFQEYNRGVYTNKNLSENKE